MPGKLVRVTLLGFQAPQILGSQSSREDSLLFREDVDFI